MPYPDRTIDLDFIRNDTMNQAAILLVRPQYSVAGLIVTVARKAWFSLKQVETQIKTYFI